MKKIIKYSLGSIGALLLVAIVVALIYREDLVRLNNVLSLFDEDKIVTNFSGMKNVFFHQDFKSIEKSTKWKENFSNMPTQYTHEKETKKISAFLEKTKTTSLLVIHDGVLVSEQYYLGTKKEDLRISWSMAKSFSSAVMGIAVEAGHIESIDDPVTKYVPSLKKSAYNDVPIRDVLNMSSGVDFDEDYLAFSSDINKMGRVLALGGSMDEFAASITATIGKSGQARQYTSIDTHVIAMVVRAATNKTLSELIEEGIWSKIGPEGKGYFLTDGHGVAFALGGLNMQSRDYAKFGLLFLNEGMWEGKQVIPKSWALESVKASAPPSTDKNDKFGYGYQWWVPVNPDQEFYAIGVYGQYIYINRKTNVVVVKTSAHRGFRDDGQHGNLVEQETIEMFRAISQHYSSR